MNLAVATYATKSYLFAWPQCIKHIMSAIYHYNEGHFIFSTDESKEAAQAVDFLEKQLPEKWKLHTIKLPITDDTSENYKKSAQLRIAQLQGAALHLARRLKCDLFWSVESEILVPPDALKISEWVLSMPDNYYDIAMVTYPNGSFLGGRGTYVHPIEEDFLPHERKIKPRVLRTWEARKKRIEDLSLTEFKNKQPTSKEEFLKRKEKIDNEFKKLHKLEEKIKHYPPDGNIFEVIGKYGWRPRGWLEHAYPAIGRGAILPTDWVGMGCTLLNKRALELANFDGYGPDYGGTQDLYLTWRRWQPAGLRMSVITHIACDHVKCELEKDKKRNGKINHFIAFHEPNGIHQGHLRIQVKPWAGI